MPGGGWGVRLLADLGRKAEGCGLDPPSQGRRGVQRYGRTSADELRTEGWHRHPPLQHGCHLLATGTRVGKPHKPHTPHTRCSPGTNGFAGYNSDSYQRYISRRGNRAPAESQSLQDKRRLSFSPLCLGGTRGGCPVLGVLLLLPGAAALSGTLGSQVRISQRRSAAQEGDAARSGTASG